MVATGMSDRTRKIEGIDQRTEKLNELLCVPLDFCNSSVPIISDFLACTDRDGNENHILLVCFPASLELNAFTSARDNTWRRVLV